MKKVRRNIIIKINWLLGNFTFFLLLFVVAVKTWEYHFFLELLQFSFGSKKKVECKEKSFLGNVIYRTERFLVFHIIQWCVARLFIDLVVLRRRYIIVDSMCIDRFLFD